MSFVRDGRSGEEEEGKGGGGGGSVLDYAVNVTYVSLVSQDHSTYPSPSITMKLK